MNVDGMDCEGRILTTISHENIMQLKLVLRPSLMELDDWEAWLNDQGFLVCLAKHARRSCGSLGSPM